MAATPCPCSSGRAYKECCAPYHKGAEPPDPPTLVRARYSAFAMGEIDFLYRTLDEDHADRVKHTRDQVLAALRAASASFKYMGLEMRESTPADAAGIARVTYRARIFRKGTDVSFVEHAEFRHDGTGWRYLAGKTTEG
jgi:SEC-C motif-containing protein